MNIESHTSKPTPSLQHSIDGNSYRQIEDRPRFLTREGVRALQQRIYKMQAGEGSTTVRILSSWQGNLRWGRNRIVSSGDTESSSVSIGREMYGSKMWTSTNGLHDDPLRAAVRRAEAVYGFLPKSPDDYVDPPHVFYPHAEPKIWHDSSYSLDAGSRAMKVAELIGKTIDKGLIGAGYLAVGANARSVGDMGDLSKYYPYTTAELTLTIRDPKRGGSGWAGIDWSDWNRVNPDKLYEIAVDKCIRSINPVAIEPGRYTTVLEPQAVCDLWSPVMTTLDRPMAEAGLGPWALKKGLSKIGLRIIDERITVSADPMDPDLGFPPFDWDGHAYQNVNWIENGVLKELAYPRWYAVVAHGHDKPLPNSEAFKISGGNTSIEEMIATTQRGVLVSRFSNVRLLEPNSMLSSGYTRDGLWLIERGKISRAIKNFRFVDSPLFVFNNIEQIGPAQRVYRPTVPAVCPNIKVNDFAFTALIDAV